MANDIEETIKSIFKFAFKLIWWIIKTIFNIFRFFIRLFIGSDSK